MAAIVAVAVLIAGSIWYFGGSGDSITASGDTKHSKKGNITTLTRDLLLDRSQFSGFDGDKWESDVGSASKFGLAPGSKRDATISPNECAGAQAGLWQDGSSVTQVAGSALSAEDRSGMQTTSAILALTGKEINLRDYLRKCQEYTVSFTSGGESMTMTTRIRVLDLGGLPNWATASSMETEAPTLPDGFKLSSTKSLSIEGYYRGVLVHIGYMAMSRNNIDTSSIGNKLVPLFNAQVAKLEAAP